MTEAQRLLVLNAWFDNNDGRLPESPEEIEWFVDSDNCPQEASRDELVGYLLTEVL